MCSTHSLTSKRRGGGRGLQARNQKKRKKEKKGGQSVFFPESRARCGKYCSISTAHFQQSAISKDRDTLHFATMSSVSPNAFSVHERVRNTRFLCAKWCYLYASSAPNRNLIFDDSCGRAVSLPKHKILAVIASSGTKPIFFGLHRQACPQLHGKSNQN